jgi:RNA polymerase sigma-70 factor (ECF subfamily)
LLEIADTGTDSDGSGPLIDALTEELNPLLKQELALAQRAMAFVRGRVKPHRWQAFWETAVGERPAAEVARELGLTVNDVFVAKNHIGNMLRAQYAALKQEPTHGGGESA